MGPKIQLLTCKSNDINQLIFEEIVKIFARVINEHGVGTLLPKYNENLSRNLKVICI